MAAALKNVVEPIFIVTAFTTGTLINRRRRHAYDVESSNDTSYLLSPNGGPKPERKAPNVLFRLLSRFFNAFPFLIEIWYWNLSYWVYQLMRAASARLIAGNEAVFLRAQSHAIQILTFERFLGLDLEQAFQQHVLIVRPWLMPILRNVYYSHITVGVCFLIYTYSCLPPALFQRIRRTIAVDNGFAFIVVTFWRCYPPRMLPEEYGFIDVLHGKGGGGNAWTNNRFQLTIAAMPSLHFGTSLFLAVCLCRFSPHRFLRILAPLWPMAMLVTIVATANHFLADAVVGACVPFLGWRYNQAVLVLKPLHDWVFSPLTSRLDLEEPPTRVPQKQTNSD